MKSFHYMANSDNNQKEKTIYLYFYFPSVSSPTLWLHNREDKNNE